MANHTNRDKYRDKYVRYTPLAFADAHMCSTPRPTTTAALLYEPAAGQLRRISKAQTEHSCAAVERRTTLLTRQRPRQGVRPRSQRQPSGFVHLREVAAADDKCAGIGLYSGAAVLHLLVPLQRTPNPERPMSR